MNKFILNLDMDHYSSYFTSGRSLTTEEQMLLNLSLRHLKKENEFTEVAFWGKIFGSDRDYFVAQGHGKDYIRNKKSFYSLDGQLWRFLFQPKSEDLANFHLIRSRFVGDPTAYHSFVDPSLYPGEIDVKNVIKEEDRLSAVVHLVDNTLAIAPIGGFVIDRHGHVVRNETFKGLSQEEALNLDMYGHLRLLQSDDPYVPVMPPFPPGGDRAIDFLEPITKDTVPSGWGICLNESTGIVNLRNYWWPGFTFYHEIKTNRFGYIYMGYGDRNDDLLFMI